MTKKGKMTCTQGLSDFKNGCPEKYGRYPDGCPAWKEYTIPQGGGKPPAVVKDCSFRLQEFWQHEALKLLEGNREATLDFRNSMCEMGPDGKSYPKVSPATLALISAITNTANGIGPAWVAERIGGPEDEV